MKAIQEAEAYPGPSLIIAYSPCEEHGYDLALSHDQMRQLTATGFWPLYRFDPRRADEGKLPLALDSRPPSDALAETLLNEQRFRRLNAQQPEVAEQLWKDAAADLQKRYDFLAQLAGKAEKERCRVIHLSQYLHGTKKKARTVVRACQFIRWLINNYHQYTNEK